MLKPLQAARLNARLARRIGWRASEVRVLTGEFDTSNLALVGGRKFDVFTDAKLAERIAESFGITFHIKDGRFAANLGKYTGAFLDTPNEALVAALLDHKRKELRNLRVSH